MEFKILHLYYDFMNLYGEYGNINILKQYLKNMNNDVVIHQKTVNDDYNLMDYDFIYIGSGTEKNLEYVLQDLKKHKEELLEYINSNKYALFTGNSYEMLGKSIDDVETLQILNFTVERLKDRKTDDVIMESSFIPNKVVGFINKMSTIKDNDCPLFSVIFGIGSDKDNKTEGIKHHNLFGTYVIGPILVRNPYFLELIIKGMYELKGNKIDKIELNENEIKGYELVLSELENRMKSK